MLYHQDAAVTVRTMQEADAAYFANAFLELGWDDRSSTLSDYYSEQTAGERHVLVAEADGRAAGYVTLVPQAETGPFAGQGIPEIKDFNVLPPFRRKGIGGKLMDCVEAVAAKTHRQVCLGVGLYADYGTAQRMYVKRGYIPDGSGVWHGEKHLAPGEQCCNDDDLNLYFLKLLH